MTETGCSAEGKIVLCHRAATDSKGSKGNADDFFHVLLFWGDMKKNYASEDVRCEK
jgi:hypothetical protein